MFKISKDADFSPANTDVRKVACVLSSVTAVSRLEVLKKLKMGKRTKCSTANAAIREFEKLPILELPILPLDLLMSVLAVTNSDFSKKHDIKKNTHFILVIRIIRQCFREMAWLNI